MSSGVSYQTRGVPGEVEVFQLGSATNPAIQFGNPNAFGGLNDGLYGTTTPSVGVSINGTSVALFAAAGITSPGSILSSSATAGIGYTTGAGSTVTQLTSRATGVAINAITGAITLFSEAQGAAVEVTFTVTNSAVAASDTVIAHHASGGTSGAYAVAVSAVTGGTFDLTISNWSAGSLTEIPVIRFAIIKSVSA